MTKNAQPFLSAAVPLLCLLLMGADRAVSLPAPAPAPSIVTVPIDAAIQLLHDDTPAAAAPNVVWMEVTAYCPCTKCCGPNAHGMTASGKDVSYNSGVFVAADTSRYAFGTRLSIPGYHDGQCVEVIDRGSAIKGEHLDVFFPTHEQALQWGRQRLPVTLIH